MEKTKILLVDDQPDQLIILKHALQASDRILFEATSGPKALDLIRKHTFALVVMDVMMPEMNGFETFAAMQQIESGQKTPVMFLTADQTDEAMARSYELGAADCLHKPVTLPILQSKVQVFIDVFRQKKQLELANWELKATQAQLIQSAKLASLGEMATGIAHELNQPLMVINLNAELGLDDLQEGLDTNVKESLETIVAQVRRASRVINHLKAFGRDNTKSEYQPEDVNQIILDSFILIRERLKLRNIRLEEHLAATLPLVSCKAVQIEQVLANILLNAMDALEERDEKIIRVRSFQEGNWVNVEIEDNGVGIPQVIQNRIFDPFFTTKEVGRGTGLGLSVSYGIVQEHSGCLLVHSEPGKGTNFIIKLPLEHV